MSDRDLGDLMWADACALLERAERLHRQLFFPGTPAGEHVCWQPPVDIFENEREILVVAVLPGVERADLDVYVDAQALVVRGLRRIPRIGRDTAIRRLEVPYGQFERRIDLSGAFFKLERWELANGCLSLSLSKQS
jgi:HSP20 family protein